MNEEQTLAYLAGFFDGEGCVGVYKKGQHKNHEVRISIAQVDPKPIQLFQSVFGGNIGIQKGNYENRFGIKDLFRLQYTGNRAKDVLANLYPYLIVKREKAAVALES